MTDQQQKPQEREEKVRWVLRDDDEIVALRLAPADQPPGGAWENIGPPDGRALSDRQKPAGEARQYQELDHGPEGRGLLVVIAVAIAGLIAALMIAVLS